tara:strand:- start:292 stop:432 length:141 start_codon:yes stop_codon:yes gene_type:complete
MILRESREEEGGKERERDKRGEKRGREVKYSGNGYTEQYLQQNILL